MQRLISVTDSYCRKSTSYSPTECKLEIELGKRALTPLKNNNLLSINQRAYHIA